MINQRVHSAGFCEQLEPRLLMSASASPVAASGPVGPHQLMRVAFPKIDTFASQMRSLSQTVGFVGPLPASVANLNDIATESMLQASQQQPPAGTMSCGGGGASFGAPVQVDSSAIYTGTHTVSLQTPSSPSNNLAYGSLGSGGTLMIGSVTANSVITQPTATGRLIDGQTYVAIGNSVLTVLSESQLGAHGSSGTLILGSANGQNVNPLPFSTSGGLSLSDALPTGDQQSVVIGNPVFTVPSQSFRLGAPGSYGTGVNGLIDLTGDLTLDGTLSVNALEGFAGGGLKLFGYSGIDKSACATLGQAYLPLLPMDGDNILALDEQTMEPLQGTTDAFVIVGQLESDHQ